MNCSRVMRKAALVCALALPIITLVGCAGSSAEVSALAKIASGQMNTLTVAEVQALALAYCPDCQLTSDQAGAIVQVLVDNNIATLTNLDTFIANALQNPSSVVLPAGFLALFQNFQVSGAPQSS
jgi:hypothetical protein